MDTPKYEKLNKVILIVGSVIVLTSGLLYADSSQAITVLAKTYGSGSVLSTEEAQGIVQSLDKVLADCEDVYLVFRIKYRIGIIYFKSNELIKSMEQFMKILEDSKCPENIKVLSLNMIGQISRMEGKNKDALDAFQQITNILEKSIQNDKEFTKDLSLMKVWVSAVISKAEIFEFQRNCSESINQYNHLLQILKEMKLKDLHDQYYAFVNDKVSQLYLQTGDIEKYLISAKSILTNSPEYSRIPLIKLEIACVEFLNVQHKSIEFPNGSFESPSLLIADIKNIDDKTQFQDIVEVFDKLCKEYKNNNGGGLLLYHYAWLLDTIGNKDKASEIFLQIISQDSINEKKEGQKPEITSTIQEYAKIQYAIMAGEKGKYNEALKVLDTLRKQPENSHLSELSKSVIESIKTLKREVPVNETEK